MLSVSWELHGHTLNHLESTLIIVYSFHGMLEMVYIYFYLWTKNKIKKENLELNILAVKETVVLCNI